MRTSRPYGTGDRAAERELRIIEKLNLAGFFVLHRSRSARWRARWRSGSWAWSFGPVHRFDAHRIPAYDLPPGRGHGSALSSIVCYLTGLCADRSLTGSPRSGRFLSEDLKALPGHRPLPARHASPDPACRSGKDRAALGGSSFYRVAPSGSWEGPWTIFQEIERVSAQQRGRITRAMSAVTSDRQLTAASAPRRTGPGWRGTSRAHAA